MYANRLAVLFALTLFAAPAVATEAPIRVIEDSLEVPAGMDVAQAMAAIEDLPALFDRFEPVIPKIPGVQLDLRKELVSAQSPVVMDLPVQGAVFGRPIIEKARVTATTEPMVCEQADGMRIELAFIDSSPNVERRIDRIEITACPRTEADGTVFIDAVGSLYEGDLPIDPSLNAWSEGIGAKAIQTAFIKQVPAVFEAVAEQWAAEQSG